MAPMRTWAPLVLPAVFFVFLVLLFILHPDASAWPAYKPFQYMPYVLLGIGFLLGGCFVQSRVSFLCLLLGVMTFLIHRSFFVKVDLARGNVIIFLSAIYLPLLTALFYHLDERGIFTFHGYVRVLVVFSAILMIVLLPGSRSLSHAISSVQPAILSSVSTGLRVPATGLLVFAGCVPVLLFRNRHESPFLGPIFCLAILYVFAGLSFRSGVWRLDQGQAVFLSFMSGAALIFTWAIMESSWRHAQIDELTDLPGRRSLKHHLARLGSSYAVAVLDIDHFKKINDRYGHDTGDQVLKFIASHLKKNAAGRAYRYGGEEFVIVSERSEFDEVVSALDDLRKFIHSRRFVMRGKDRPRKKPQGSRPAVSRREDRSLKLAVSIGVAKRSDRYASPQDVLDAADKALYRAKKDGRNCLKTARS